MTINPGFSGGGFADQARVRSVIDERLVEKQRRAGGIRGFEDAPDFLRFQHGSGRVVRIVQQHCTRRFHFDAPAQTVHWRSK